MRWKITAKFESAKTDEIKNFALYFLGALVATLDKAVEDPYVQFTRVDKAQEELAVRSLESKRAQEKMEDEAKRKAQKEAGQKSQKKKTFSEPTDEEIEDEKAKISAQAAKRFLAAEGAEVRTRKKKLIQVRYFFSLVSLLFFFFSCHVTF